MSRQRQLWVLIVLTAITMMPQYALQGFLTTGGHPQQIAEWVWMIDAGTWSLRALIESLVLGFLFSIQAQEASATEQKILLLFEIALVGLIAATLGPTLASIGRGQSMTQFLHPWVHSLWAFGIASYAPLMLSATGFAFKLESRKGEEQFLPAAQPQRKTDAMQNAKGMQRKTQKAQPQRKRDATLELIENGIATSKADIARSLQESPSTTKRRIDRLESDGILQADGKGWYEVTNGKIGL